MAVRDILVVIGGEPASTRRARQVIDLAGRLGASVTGAFLRPMFPLTDYGAGGAWMSQGLLQEAIEAHAMVVDRTEARAQKAFLGAAELQHLAADWIVLDTVQQLIERARLSDLVVVPPGPLPEGGEVTISAGQLGLACGGPLLVVPDHLGEMSIGRRVLVCWNGSRESARAWRDAWPFILAADNVAVAAVRPRPDFDDDAALRFRLSRGDREVDVLSEPAPDELAPDVLRRKVRGWGSDLLVMGLYGRPRISEVVFGGVSQEFLADPPCPLLISH